MYIFIKTGCVLQQYLYPINKKQKNKQTACLFFALFESVEIEKWDVEGRFVSLHLQSHTEIDAGLWNGL